MVSYYNFPMYPKNHGTNLTYTPSPSWYPGNYHQPPNQFLGDTETPPQTMYYHHPMFQSSPDWAAHENFTGPQSALLPPNSHGGGGGGGGGGGIGGGGGGGGGTNGNIGSNNGHIGNSTTPGTGPGLGHLNQNNGNSDHIAEGISSLPSPPITVSGSEMSSPGAPNGASSPQTANSRQTPTKNSFSYDWMKKPSYQSQPNPGSINNIICSAPSLDDFTPLEPCGMEFARKLNRKTRTKDKYRVVYSDHQRLELEKEFHTSRYITIRRKTELAQFLQLSERQVKIWFQNRRAKERKQAKKRDDNPNGINGGALPQHHNSSLLDVKPKLEPGYHPALHQMGAMSMGMTPMGLHHHHHHPLHSHLSVPTSQVGVSSVLGI